MPPRFAGQNVSDQIMWLFVSFAFRGKDVSFAVNGLPVTLLNLNGLLAWSQRAAWAEAIDIRIRAGTIVARMAELLKQVKNEARYLYQLARNVVRKVRKRVNLS